MKRDLLQRRAECTILIAALSLTSCVTDAERTGATGSTVTGLPSNAMTISCQKTSSALNVSITGPIQAGVFTSLTGSQIWLEYGSETDGWQPYSSGSKPRVQWTTDWADVNLPTTYTLALPPNTDNFNFFLYAPINSAMSWFNLDLWTTSGSCYRSGGGIRQGTTSSPPPPGVMGTLTCKNGSAGMVISVDGDVAAGVFGGAPSDGDVRLEYGSITDGWLPYVSGKPFSQWYSWQRSYSLTLGSNVDGFNFMLYGTSTQAQRWFDLSKWQIVGDCKLGSGAVYRNVPPPSNVPLSISCSWSGPDLTYTINGRIQDGLVSTAPSCSTSMLLEYGSDTDGWGLYSSGKPYGYFHPELTQHQLTIGGSRQSVNFVLYCPSNGASSWFKLDAWTVGGSCYRTSGQNIKH